MKRRKRASRFKITKYSTVGLESSSITIHFDDDEELVRFIREMGDRLNPGVSGEGDS